MKQSIEREFSHVLVSGCLEVNSQIEFQVFDSEASRSYIRTEVEQPIHLVVKNPQKQPIHFLAIDRCVLGHNDPSCDCALFDNTVFYFVEIKTAYNMDESHSKRSNCRRDAREQLGNVIAHFKTKNLPFDKYQVQALICLVRNNVFPTRNAAKSDASVEFEDDYNATLLEGNSIIFE